MHLIVMKAAVRAEHNLLTYSIEYGLMAMLMEYESSGNMPLSSWADGNVDEI
jgi:hypothetical protein